MTLQGLRQVDGLSFEEICARLDEAGIKYKVEDKPNVTSHFFRESRIGVSKEGFGRISQILPMKSSRGKYCSFYEAYYEVEEGFDHGILDGDIRFKGGHLVERTAIPNRPYEEYSRS